MPIFPPTQEHLKLFLSYLAVERRISASTQKLAFNSLLYLFRKVLAVPVQGLECVVRARSGKRLPVVLSVGEVRVFPSQKLSIDPRLGEVRRYHVYPTGFQGAFKLAVARAEIVNRPPFTLSVTVSRPIWWNADTTFAQSRNYWGIRMYLPR
jgi:hypothetical protein